MKFRLTVTTFGVSEQFFTEVVTVTGWSSSALSGVTLRLRGLQVLACAGEATANARNIGANAKRSVFVLIILFFVPYSGFA